MTTDNWIYVGDVGTEFTFGFGQDISAATEVRVLILKPDLTEVVWEWADLVPVDSETLKYTTVDGDLDKAGTWKFQPVVSIGGNTYHCKTAEHQIYARYN
jgi:hypothetical protein